MRELLAVQDWAQLLATYGTVVREWAIVSTCHRFELYVVAESDEIDSLCCQLQAAFPAVTAPVAKQGFASEQKPWIVRMDEEATEHLCRVAAGLDSLVLGEAQIQGQVIATYTRGLENGTIGPVLSSLFRTAIRVGKRARTETQISTHAISMSSVALSMAARTFPNFTQARVLVIGAGEMSQLALKALLQRHVTMVTVANRTFARAEAVLMDPTWQAIGLEQLPDALRTYDVIFSATSALDFVITREQMAQAQLAQSAPRPQVLIDLAVPRDIDPAIRDLPGVVLIDVDDLRQGLDQSLENRQQALPAVSAIIDSEMERWRAEQRELSMRPVVVELRQRAERIRQQEVERTMHFIGPVDAETREHIQHMSRALVNKLLHEPTTRLKELAHAGQTDVTELYLSAICDIFGLENVLPGLSNPEDAKLRGEPSQR
jgi:glutamyl-tRNA reductase